MPKSGVEGTGFELFERRYVENQSAFLWLFTKRQQFFIELPRINIYSNSELIAQIGSVSAINYRQLIRAKVKSARQTSYISDGPQTHQNMPLELQFVNSIGMTDRELSEVENLFGTGLPPEVRTFLKLQAGSKPTVNGDICCFDIKHSNGWKQSSFIERIVNFESILVQLDCREYLHEFVVCFGLTSDYVEADYLFPIAELPAGALLMAVSGRHAGKVYSADNGDFGILFHSQSLAAFWASVYKWQM